MRIRILGDFFRRAGGDDGAAAAAAFRAHVDQPVRGLDDVQIVFDDDHRVAVITQSVQHGEQLVDVVEVQSGGGLIKYVESLAGVAA